MSRMRSPSDPLLKPALKTFGVFSQPEYYGEEYADPDPNPYRERPREGVRPFYVAGGYSKSKAANKDGYFDEFKRAFTGDDQNGLIRRRSASEQRVQKYWVPPGAGKKLCGVGSQYGNFTTIIPSMDNSVREAPKKPISQPNFYTNPGKKGTGYGYANVAFSPLPEWQPGDGISSNLNAISVREINQKHVDLCLGRAPFINALSRGRDFDQNPYAGVDPLAPGGRPVINFRETETPQGKLTSPVFYPSRTFITNKFPEYESEPYMELRKILEGRARSKPPRGQPIWYPPATTAMEKPSMSVLNKNIDLAINPVTRKTTKFVTNFCENK
ncbi:unnamed protein product [Hymenolepis diminuta]|uniref:Cilia-and flagella-associated protein 96 n=1 Tax=Hymenolepis diminuta TaxID=6216 RepID=A0A564YDQ3_HYMDI|nr:unnamed protein product [Hymenolepis diminuta]